VAQPHGKKGSMRPTRRIRVPTGFSEYAEAAFAPRSGWPRTPTPNRTCSRPSRLSLHARGRGDPAEAADVRVADAERGVGRLVGTRKDLGSAARPRVCTGVPFHEILESARRQDIDPIVMATHGRRGLAHALRGRATERIVRAAPGPVFTVRHPAIRT